MRSKRHSYLLTLAHICADINQGALPAMLPFLIAAYGLGYAQAAAFVLACSIISAVVQPLFGWLGDRVQKPWIMSLGIFLAGLGISLMGFTSNYWLLFSCAALSGVGVAMFHPEGGRLANVVAGDRKGEGMGNFGMGGVLGFSVGALLVAVFFSAFGMYGALVFIVPTTAMALFLLTQARRFKELTAQEQQQAAGNAATQRDNWPEFAKVTVSNILRSVIFQGFNVFVPLYWVAVFDQPEAVGSLLLMVISLAGSLATFLGGRVADRIGFKKDIVIFSALLAVLVAAFIFADNPVLAGILVTLSMMCLNMAYSPIIALSQGHLPNPVALASGISLGASVSLGGVVAPMLGGIGDAYGLTVVFAIICALSVAMCVSGLILKSTPLPSPRGSKGESATMDPLDVDKTI
jgi:FSR family fosmidomycin resistance protein-like MFS transporter